MTARTTVTVIIVAIGLGGVAGTVAECAELAIIVNKRNSVDSITQRDLGKIYKGERQFWGGSNRERVLVLMTAVKTPERDIALSRIYGMTERELKKFWIKKRLSGRAPNVPKDLPSSRLVKRAVASRRNAIGYVFAKDVDETVKVLRVDGSAVLR